MLLALILAVAAAVAMAILLAVLQRQLVEEREAHQAKARRLADVEAIRRRDEPDHHPIIRAQLAALGTTMDCPPGFAVVPPMIERHLGLDLLNIAPAHHRPVHGGYPGEAE